MVRREGVWWTMLSEAERLQEKAKRARTLAKSILDPAAEERLLALADQLEDQAREMEQRTCGK